MLRTSARSVISCRVRDSRYRVCISVRKTVYPFEEENDMSHCLLFWRGRGRKGDDGCIITSLGNGATIYREEGMTIQMKVQDECKNEDGE